MVVKCPGAGADAHRVLGPDLEARPGRWAAAVGHRCFALSSVHSPFEGMLARTHVSRASVVS